MNTPQLPTRDMVDSPCWGVSTGRYAGVSNVDPTTVTDDHYVRAKPPCAPSQKTLGKWLVFKPLEELDETWHMIRRAVESGELDSTGAKSSTAMPDPSRHPKDPTEGVICVYTSEETMDEVGFKLVNMVKQDIPYKTDEATLQGKYVATGYRNVSLQIIYWNDGNPYLKKHEEAKERPRLQLQPRTKPLDDTSGQRERGGGGGGGRNSSSIFGEAKPVDTAARDREIEERLLRERDQERAKRGERGDRSWTDEGGKRGEWRGDRRGRYDSGDRWERGRQASGRECDELVRGLDWRRGN